MFGYRSLGFGAFPNRDVTFSVANSALFNDDDSDYMEKQLSSAPTSDRICTFAFWVKRSSISNAQKIITQGQESGGVAESIHIYFLADDKFEVLCENTSGAVNIKRTTTQLFRDPHAWYHFCIRIDGSQTDDDSCTIELNGTAITAFDTKTNPSSSTDLATFNNVKALNIGRLERSPSGTFGDYYLAQFVGVDGTALAASNFGKFDTAGRWQPINPLTQGITFGNNGFYLPFTETNIGHDASGSSTAATLNFVGFTASGSSGSTLEDYTANTYSSVSVGSNENSSRIIFVAAVTTGGGSGTDGLSGITCGGVTGTKVFENLGTDHQQIAVFRFDGISSGTTKDIVTTYQRSTKRGGIYVFDGTGLSLNPNTFVSTLSSSSTAITSDFDIQAGSAAMAITVHANGEARHTLTHAGITEHTDVGLGPDAGSPSGSGTQTGAGSATFASAVAAQTLTVTPSGTVPLRSTAFLVFGPEGVNNFQPK